MANANNLMSTEGPQDAREMHTAPRVEPSVACMRLQRCSSHLEAHAKSTVQGLFEFDSFESWWTEYSIPLH